jgi:hypothetical protein
MIYLTLPMLLVGYMSEISLYTDKYLLGFAFTEALDKPLSAVFILLYIIASIYTVASWQDIVGSVPTTFGHGNPVVLRQLMPQSSRSTAISAAIFPVIEASNPFGLSKSGRDTQFTRLTDLLRSPPVLSLFCGIRLIPLLPSTPHFLLVINAVLRFAFAALIWIFGTITFAILTLFFWVLAAPAPITCCLFIWIVFAPLTIVLPQSVLVGLFPYLSVAEKPLAVGLVIFSPISLSFVAVGFGVQPRIIASAYFALLFQSIIIAGLSVKVFGGGRKRLVALATSLCGKIIGTHGITTPMGQSPTVCAVRGLFVSFIIPQNGAMR